MSGMELHDPYEDQLSAARFKAERDIARQELDRMRPAYEWVEERGGLSSVKCIYSDFRAVVERLGVEWSESELHGLMDVLDRRLLPEGMEWPRYEDGEQVLINDEALLSNGITEELYQVHFYGTGFSLYTETCDIDYEYGMRVMRPVLKVLDADGVEIHNGEMLYHVETGDELTVIAIDAENEDAHVRWGYDFEDKTGTIKANLLTHRAPVLGADNKPLREGETVWHVETGSEFRVLRTPRSTVKVDVTWREGFEDKAGSVPPQKLTHERPDSWERLEEDARQLDVDLSDTTDDYPRMRCCRDLVRRAKALAERGQ